LIDPRTGYIDRAWYLFFLSLNNVASAVIDDSGITFSSESIIASYEAALQALAQEVETQPPPVDLSAELIKQIQAAGLEDCCSGLLSQVAEMQKQIETLYVLPPPSLGTVVAVTATAPVVSSGGIAPDISLAASYGDTQNPYAAKTANYVLAGPMAGAAAVPAFRALVAADIPVLPYGDVFGPASATDNAVARFDSTTGKLIQNSVVTISDTGATTGITTLAASTSVTTPIVQASNSAGLSLKNASGTTQMSVGAGGGDNMSINVSTNLNGTNAQIDISPTGTGHVHIKPSGIGSVEVAPTNVGTIDNMTIGATTPKNASVVDLSVTGTLSFDAAQGTAGQVLTSAGTGVTPTWTTPVINTVSAPVTKTANFTVADGEAWLINNKSGSTCTVTLPAAASWTGRQLIFKNMQAQTLVSASSDVVPIDSTSAGTAILLAVVGNWATMVSDGTNWIIMQQAANNCLLLE
jgi:hypothetical protein